MSEITLVRQPVEILDADKGAARRVLFGVVDGLGEQNQKRWRRFVNSLFRLEPGEMAEITTRNPRIPALHRRHMAMEQAVFAAQERFAEFNRGFRDWLKVGAGHCDWFPGPKGGVFPVPKSISYAAMEEGDMQEFHGKCVDFLRTEYAQNTLWPHLTVLQRNEMAESLLMGFE